MRKTCFFVGILLCLASFAGAAQEWAPPGVDIGGSRTPVPMPDGVELSDVHPEFVPSLPTGYYLNDAVYDGQPFILLYRDRLDGKQEILMSVVQEEESPHALTYVEGSFEGSGERFLYFMLVNGKTLHGSLYLFSPEDNRMNLVLEEPCGTNMAIFEDPPADIAGLGWIAFKDYILPIRLSDGSSEEPSAASIKDLGGMPAIAGDFFGGELHSGERKYTYFTPVDRGLLLLTTAVTDAAGELVSSNEYLYDCVNRRLVSPNP